MAAIVLAGERDGEDELARYAGASCKALVEIDGRTMLLRVLDTLSASPAIASIVLCGPHKDKLADETAVGDLLQTGQVSWQAPQAGPSASAYAALGNLSVNQPALLTTADHPLLTTEIIDAFCRLSIDTGADVVIGLAPFALVREAFPTMKKTVLHFKGAELCGCNLFAFLTPKGREVADFWRELESQRKKPLRIIRFLGWWTVVKYLFRALTIDSALKTFSSRLGIKVQAVVLPFADAAVDVDSVSDYRLVEERIRHRSPESDQPQ
jgi:CTP:molybdopterin cytidylyltransferase MocA